MQIRATISPAQNGSQCFAAQYGKWFVCVRYYYDTARRKRITSIKLTIVEKDG